MSIIRLLMTFFVDRGTAQINLLYIYQESYCIGHIFVQPVKHE
jgi:hypothetical protein